MHAAAPLAAAVLLHLVLFTSACHVVFDYGNRELTPEALGIQQSNVTRSFRKVIRCDGVSPFFIIPYIWKPQVVKIECSTFAIYSIYSASSQDELAERYAAKDKAWCGLPNLVQGGPCTLQMSPFGSNYIGITGASSSCTIEETFELNYLMLSCFAAGLVIFALAGTLSRSTGFRVTSGGLLFALGSVIILMYVMMRLVPNRRGIAATVALMGSTSLGILRWLTGQWLPSLATLIHNKWFMGYVVLTGLLGSAVTYIYGGTDNYKINNVVRVGLQLLALILVYYGTWTHLYAAAAAITAVVVMQMVVSLNNFLSARFGRGSRTKPARYPEPDADGAESEELQSNQQPSQQAAQGGSSFFGGLRTPQPPSGRKDAAGGRGAASVTPNGTGGWLPSRGKLTPGSGRYHAEVGEEEQQQAQQGQQQAGGDVISPLVRAGKIVNPLSGRDIKIGGDLYEDLVGAGFTPDLRAGVLRPPPTTPGSTGGSGWDQAAAGARSSARRRRKSGAGVLSPFH